MKNVGKFIKKNKSTVIVVSCCLLLTIFVFTIKLVFFPNEGRAIYGDRLADIKESKIKDSELEQVKSKLTEKEDIEKVSTHISGRILNILITVSEKTSIETAKTFTATIDEALSEEQKKAYDIQVFVMKTTADDKFPIIGYRHQKSDHYSWTKDR